MKIRNGFVSNSSSSSFMVGLPKGLTEKQSIDFLIKKMGVDKDSFFYFVAKNIADCILSSKKISKIDQLIDDFGYSNYAEFRIDYPEIVDLFEKCQEKSMDVFSGSVSNESYEIGEQLFCDMDWQVNDEDFYINKKASF